MIKLNKGVFKSDDGAGYRWFYKYYIPIDLSYNATDNPFDILDKYLLGLEGAFVAGGAVLSLLQNKKPRDIDFFFETKTYYDYAMFVFNNAFGEPIYQTNNATGFYDENNDVMLELVHKFFGTPEQVMLNFDFTVCAGAYYIDSNVGRIFLGHIYQLIDVAAKQLRIACDINMLEPHQLLYRVLKYTSYGYHIEYYDMMKVIKIIQSDKFDINKYQQIHINADVYETWNIDVFCQDSCNKHTFGSQFDDL